jgi:hypothetical protein
VYSGIVTVVTDPIGQFVTVAGQAVTVLTLVVWTVYVENETEATGVASATGQTV